MSPLDLIRSNRDGGMSLTKVVALVAHVLVAVMFVRLQWSEPFNETLWVIYLGATIFHAVYDKTAAQVKAYKEGQRDELVDAALTPLSVASLASVARAEKAS